MCLRLNFWFACNQMLSKSCFFHKLMPLIVFLSLESCSLQWNLASLHLDEPRWMHQGHPTSCQRTSEVCIVLHTYWNQFGLEWNIHATKQSTINVFELTLHLQFQLCHQWVDHTLQASCINFSQYHHLKWSCQDASELLSLSSVFRYSDSEQVFPSKDGFDVHEWGI